jgi:hypothetical protein
MGGRKICVHSRQQRLREFTITLIQWGSNVVTPAGNEKPNKSIIRKLTIGKDMEIRGGQLRSYFNEKVATPV